MSPKLQRLLLPAGLLLSIPVFAQEMPIEGPVDTTVLVRAEAKNPMPLDVAQLRLEVNGHLTPVSSVTPVRPSSAQVAILIDDGLRSSFGTQLKELTNFIQQLPGGTSVLVGYMQNGTVRTEGFTTDHGKAVSEVRVPLSSAGISASPYFCVSEFVKHWPGNASGPRFVLMITNGVDPYNGSTSPLNQDSPYVENAQRDAERAGVPIYSIYYGDRGMRGGNANFSGQSYLQQIAEATGGESFYQGLIQPVSFAPYLDRFRRAIAESYEVHFAAPRRSDEHKQLTYIKLKTEQKGLKLHAPEAVQPGRTVSE